MEFKDKVTYARKKLGLTQKEFAIELDSSYSMINEWENGRTVPNRRKQELFFTYCSEKGIRFENEDTNIGLKLVDAQQIKVWFEENTRNSQGIFPELIKKLISESIPNTSISHMYFPTGDMIYTTGPDGELETIDGNMYVPFGKSIWEFGATTKHSINKINEDYQKRLDDTPKCKRDETTFVLVTPSVSIRKDAFYRKHSGEWKKIIILDANDIEQWLSFCLNTSTWLINIYQRSSIELYDIDNAWKRLSNKTVPALTISFYLARREKEERKFIDMLSNSSKKQIRISSHSSKESYGFVTSILEKNCEEYKNKVIFVGDLPTLKTVEKLASGKIFVLNFRLSNYTFNPNNQYILTYGKEYDEFIEMDIELELRPASIIYNVLEKEMNVNKNKLYSIKNKSNNNTTLIINSLASPNELICSPWQRDDLEMLAPIAILGRVNTNSKEDIDVLSILVDDVNDYLCSLQKWKRIDDSPVYIDAGIIKCNEKAALWIQLKDCLIGFYAKVCNIMDKIFASYNPIFDLEEKQRFVASFFNKKWSYNGYIVEGLFDSLTLYAIYCNMQPEIDSLIKKLLNNVSNDKYMLTFSKYFTRIVEVSPESFVGFVTDKIIDNSFDVLFKQEDGNALMRNNYYCELLWALEKLTLFEDYKFDALDLLYYLYKKDYKYSISNCPKDSLLNRLTFINDETTLTYDDKENYIINKLKTDYNELSVSLIISLLQKDSCFLGLDFKWREHAFTDAVLTRKRIYVFYKNVINALLLNQNINVTTVLKIYDMKYLLSKDLIENIFTFIENHFHQNSREGYELYNFFIKEKYQIKSFGKDETDFLLESIDRLIILFEPSDMFEKNSVYFKDFGFGGCPILTSDDDDYDKREKKVFEFRKRIFKQIVEKYSLTIALKKMFSVIPNNGFAGQIFVDYSQNEEEYYEILKQCIESKKYQVLSAIINLNLEASKKYIKNLNDTEFTQIIPALRGCNGEILSDEFLRNEHNKKLLFSDRGLRIDPSDYEKVNVRLYNPAEYLNWMEYRVPIDKWNFEEVLSTLELVTSENIADNVHCIEKIITQLDSIYYSEKLVEIEFKFRKIFVTDRFPNAICKYLFLHPNDLISILVNNLTEYTSLRYEIKSRLALPKEFYNYRDELSSFINVFMNFHSDDSSVKYIRRTLGEVLARSSNICHESVDSIEVRKIIEYVNDDDVNNGYEFGFYNLGGLRTVDDGTLLHNKADELNALAKKIRIEYPQCSRILLSLAKEFFRESKQDKINSLVDNDIL